MPDIDRPSHTLPSAHQKIASRLDVDPVTEEDVEDTDDGRTLADFKWKRDAGASQRGTSSPGGEALATPLKKPRTIVAMCKAIITSDDDDDHNHP